MLGFELNIPRVKAQDAIHRKLYEPWNYPEVYRLYLEATDDRSLAKVKQSEALMEYMKMKIAATKASDGRASN